MIVQNRNHPRSLRKKILCCLFTCVILLILLNPNLNALSSYNFIEKGIVLQNLHKEVVKNFTSLSAFFCQYNDIIFDETTLSPDDVINEDLVESHSIREGGEYYPLDCKTKFSVAIIVPYRDKPEHPRNIKSPAEQLRNFLVYMHTFLRRQQIHYRIFVIEQLSPRSGFNRGKLWNIGAKNAVEAGFPCLILHDVDLLPIKVANIYACTKLPRHMSPCINTMRYVLPHVRVFHGAKAILSKQFLYINGMSNNDHNWGVADRDLYFRLEVHNITPCRFGPQISQYYDMSYRQLKRKNWDEHEQPVNYGIDGLNTLHYTKVVTVMHQLFTHIVVDLALQAHGLDQLKQSYSITSKRFTTNRNDYSN